MKNNIKPVDGTQFSTRQNPINLLKEMGGAERSQSKREGRKEEQAGGGLSYEFE